MAGQSHGIDPAAALIINLWKFPVQSGGYQNGRRKQDSRLAQVAGPGWAEQSGKPLPGAFTVNKRWGMGQVTAPHGD